MCAKLGERTNPSHRRPAARGKELTMKILFYGTASYDRDSFTKELKSYPDVKIDFIETNLTPMTAALARGYDAVCAFVNADAGAMTLEILASSCC